MRNRMVSAGLFAVVLLAFSVIPISPAQASPTGFVKGWGSNVSNQIDPTLITEAPTPALATVGLEFRFTDVAAGGAHSLALRDDGMVLSWGANGSGQLGDGNFLAAQGEQGVRSSKGGFLKGVIAIAAGDQFSLALTSDGKVWAWGDNGKGQLGDGANLVNPKSATAVKVANLDNVIAIAAGHAHALALRADGTVWAWGWNSAGQLGDGTQHDRNVPVGVKDPAGGVRAVVGRVIALAAGTEHSLALRDNGTVLAWGGNDEGRLGDGTTDIRLTPVPVLAGAGRTDHLDGVIGISAGFDHSLALRADATVWAWGGNQFGQLGTDITTPYRPTPERVEGLEYVKMISAGNMFSLALHADATVETWGLNAISQLGYALKVGNPAYFATPVPLGGPASDDVLAAFAHYSSISAGGAHGLGVFLNAGARATGSNTAGQLADGTNQGRKTPVNTLDILVDSQPSVAAVAAGGEIAPGAEHSLFLDVQGQVWAAGSNTFGQLDGTPAPPERNKPVTVPSITPAKKAVAAGGRHSLALTANGFVASWGADEVGQLGDGGFDGTASGVSAVGGVGDDHLGDVKAIAAGQTHGLALLADGTVWAWGGNSRGQLGDGSTTGKDLPVQVRGPGGQGVLTGVKAIAAGGEHSLALLSDGTVMAWGANPDGQLGDDTITDRLAPVHVKDPGAANALLANVKALAGGGLHSLALTASGRVRAWGNNQAGQLGDNSTTNRHTPVSVQDSPGKLLDGVIAVAGGGLHSLALRDNGLVYGWGDNSFGQLGDGTKTSRHTAVKMKKPFKEQWEATAVAAGGSHSLAVAR